VARSSGNIWKKTLITEKSKSMTDNETIDAVTTAPDVIDSENASVEAVTVQGDALADALAKAREQEKNKLYPQMEKMREELAALKSAEQERIAQEDARKEQRRQRDAEAAAQKKREEEETLELRDLLSKKEAEWQSQLEAERTEREKAFALLEREREFQELQQYRAQRIEQERDNIIPDLIDMVQGNTVDEVEASISALKAKSANIFDSVAQAAQASRKEMQGSRITVPASGPLDNDSDSRSYSPENIAEMSLADYAKNRSKLLGGASNNRGQGLFG
jgi:DNA repair exonuclease SbcCD ATPase subunit